MSIRFSVRPLSTLQPLRVCLPLLVVFWLTASTVWAQDSELLTGLPFRQTLAQPIEAVSWKGKTFRGALGRITESQRIAIMLDRRIDPDQEVEFSATKIPLELMIEQLVREHETSSCLVGSLVYVGPAATCELLPTVVELRRDDVRALPAAKQRKLLRSTIWNWERMTTPRGLLDRLENEYGIQIAGKENMPHDLWPAMRLPPCDFAAKLSLVLAGFHVTFELSDDGETARIVAMPNEASLSRKYDTGGRTNALKDALAGKFADASIRAQGNQLIVDGRWEVHDAVDRLLKGESVRPPPSDGGTKNYTLTVENKPVGGVVRALGNQLGKTVSFDDVKLKRRLTRDVSLAVREVSLDELLSAVLSPAGLKYDLQGETIRVYD